MAAIEQVTASATRTPDLGGTARTAGVTAAVCDALAAAVPA
jgi:isocitrate/isopropylmalate dehydrogenase